MFTNILYFGFVGFYCVILELEKVFEWGVDFWYGKLKRFCMTHEEKISRFAALMIV